MIRIICVGKLKEKFYQEATLEYLKRLQKYHKVIIEEVMDSNMKQESILIQKKIHEKDFVVTLEIEGKEMSSKEFSNFLDKTFLKTSSIIFIIGGSDGLSEEIKKRANEKISFSRLTFPHQLFRVILLEQIYRGFKIIANESYHK